VNSSNLHCDGATIEPLKSDRTPSVVFVLGVSSHRERHPDNWKIETETLDTWYLGRWRVKGQNLTCESLWSGSRAGQLWELIEEWLPERRSAWLFSGSLGRDLTLTDFWGQLHDASGDDRPGGKQPGLDERNHNGRSAARGGVGLSRVRRRAHRNHHKSNWSSSLVVDDDRCTAVIARCRAGANRQVDGELDAHGQSNRRADNAGSLVLVDTRNYFFPVLTAESAIARLRECQQHVEELIGLVKTENLGPLRLTGASQAWTSWRRRPVSDTVECHQIKEVRELEARSYFGGRASCFRHGIVSGPTWVLDVQWSYPSIMVSERLPRRLIDHGENNRNSLEVLQTETRGYIADVFLDTKSQVFPLRDGSRVRYVTGRFWTTLAGRELEKALLCGCVQKIGQWSAYELGGPLKSWAVWLRKRWCHYRSIVRDREADILKQFGRALYGRFARRLPQWEDCKVQDQLAGWGLWPEIDAQTGKVEIYRGMGDRVSRLVRREPAEDTLIAMSAFIAAAARVNLAMLIRLARPENVRYCHTDSVHVSREGRHHLIAAGMIAPGEMGKLQEKEYAEEAEYCGINHYRLGSQWTVAGLHLTRNQVGPNQYTVTDQQRLRGILAAGPDGTVSHETWIKNRPANNYGGITWADGRVTPEREERAVSAVPF
jgi:hypothetical protein